MTNLWSGRFDTAPDAAAFDFGASFRFDRRLFEDDVTGSVAWARALRKAGVLTPQEAEQLETTLAALLDAARADPAFVAGDDEDVHSFVERQLVERVGDAGRRLHTGRSRNEQVSLDLRLYLRRRIPLLQRAVAAVVGALAAQAASAGDALMPSFTHFRPAQPVLVAHFFLSHAAPLRRDFARLAGARDEADALPLGSGAIAGTAYAVDVDALAKDLGFSRIVDNSMDASSDRDFAATFLYACAMTMVHLSRLAEDLIIFCGDEHRFFELSDALSTGSSMMPQKKNPDPLELVRGKSGRAIGHLVGMLTTIKGLPTGYNKDLQEDKEAVFGAEDTLAGCLAVVKSVGGGLTLNRSRAASVASGQVEAIRAAIGPPMPVPLRQVTVQPARDRGGRLPSAWPRFPGLD
jgi:argininosuccinate lyase